MPAATHSEETTEQAIRSVCERVGITSLKEKQREALKAIVCNKKDTFMSTDGLWQKPLLRPAPVTLRQTSLSRGWDLNRDLHLSTNGHYDGTEEQICA